MAHYKKNNENTKKQVHYSANCLDTSVVVQQLKLPEVKFMGSIANTKVIGTTKNKYLKRNDSMGQQRKI